MNGDETIIEPKMPIIDSHHHLWDRRDLGYRSETGVRLLKGERRWSRSEYYLLDELRKDTESGHNIRATVFIECRSMYRADTKTGQRFVGEVEFANGIAAMSASGGYGSTVVCAGIIGHADLDKPDEVEDVLTLQVEAGGGRFRGIRQWAACDKDARVLGRLSGLVQPGLYCDPAFRKGFRLLEKFGLTFDAWVLEPQLGEVLELARAFPNTTIILDHVGTPVGIGAYEGVRSARFDGWRRNIKALAACDNVVVKLGGLGMACCGFPWKEADKPLSKALAAAWSPYVDSCIEAFTPSRCMFESNFPVDSYTCSYSALWNAFKRIAAHYSDGEKSKLFFETANQIYKLKIGQKDTV